MIERKPGQLWWINFQNGDEFYVILNKASDRGDDVMWNIFRHKALRSMEWSEDCMQHDVLVSE